MQWVNAFGGAYVDTADSVKIDGDGNVIVAGQIIQVATFSDGGQLGNTESNTSQRKQIILKLDGNTGDIIWKTYTDYVSDADGYWTGGDNEIVIAPPLVNH